jgi:RNA polymerase sigma-70 factor (ECF subfamily)
LAALASLPEDQADAVRARVIDEVGYEALAHKLDCSPSVARQRVSRGLRAIRAELETDR